MNPPPTDEELFNKALIQFKPKFEEKKLKAKESDSDQDEEEKGEAVIGAIWTSIHKTLIKLNKDDKKNKGNLEESKNSDNSDEETLITNEAIIM